MTSLSHSSLQNLQACPLKYKFSKIDGVRRLGQTRGRRRGAAFSDALEHRDPGKIHVAYEKHLRDAVSQHLIDDMLIERDILEKLYSLHDSTFKDDQREIEFDLPIGDTPYRNRGRIDSAILDTATGEIDELGEDKLLMMWTRADEKALPLNGQVLRYMSAISSADRIVYRITPYPGAYRRKDESGKQYAMRVIQDLDKKHSKDELFKVFTLTRDELQDAIDRYDADLLLRAEEVSWRTANDNWPAAWGDACKAYGGCEYLEACKREPGFQELYSTREDRENAGQ